MADPTESRVERTAMETSGDEGETTTRAEGMMVTRPGKLYPLNSPRIATDVIKRIAVQLGLPDTASRAS